MAQASTADSPKAGVRVVLAGGGTTGHIAPMIATAEAIRRLVPDADLSCVGTTKGLETRLVPDAGLALELVAPVPMPRKPTPDLLRVPARLAGSVREAGAILDAHAAQVVVGFGGYASMPAYLAARRRGIPVVLHEANAVPGLANKLAARFAKKVLACFPGTPLPHVEQVGMPVRPALDELAAVGRASRQRAAREALGLDVDRPTLLVTGGSQGARSINTATMAARDEILAAGVQILHVWGPKNFTDDMTVITDESSGGAYHPVPYVDGMENAYAAADLVVCRSGAATVYEAGLLGLPAIFVPLPHGNGEQARNATFLVEGGAGVLVPNAELDAPRLIHEVLPLLNDPERLAAVRQRLAGLVPRDAAADLAAVVLDVAKGA